MTERPTPSPVETTSLSLSHAEQWTLHHVLLDRLDRDGDEATADERHLRRAFERIDAGETTFTRAQLAAIQAVLARYHHATTWWEVERPRLEGLLRQVTTALER